MLVSVYKTSGTLMQFRDLQQKSVTFGTNIRDTFLLKVIDI